MPHVQIKSLNRAGSKKNAQMPREKSSVQQIVEWHASQ
jgi:hypothetical protein